MLTIAAVKAARPKNRAYKIFDGHGMFLFIAPTGLKSWRMKYRYAGKEKLLTFGQFPSFSLSDARTQRDRILSQLQDGTDPSRAPMSNQFEAIARTWHALQKQRWSDSHAADVLSSLDRDVFPAIGAHDVAQIRATDILNVIGCVEARSCVPTARRLRQRISAIFRYAISQELAERDPAAIIDQAMMPSPLSRPQVALSNIDDARALLAASDKLGGMRSIRLASRFLALTAARMDSVRGARWEEFEGLGSDTPIWRVPPCRMKLSRAKKQVQSYVHIVPLSAAAIVILDSAAKAAGQKTGFPCGGIVFPGRNPILPIGAGAIRALYVRAGYDGRHVPHGWRATFSTVMNEIMPEARAAIDLALAHTPKDKVEAAYNRSLMLDQRKQIFDCWGELLCGKHVAAPSFGAQTG